MSNITVLATKENPQTSPWAWLTDDVLGLIFDWTNHSAHRVRCPHCDKPYMFEAFSDTALALRLVCKRWHRGYARQFTRRFSQIEFYWCSNPTECAEHYLRSVEEAVACMPVPTGIYLLRHRLGMA